MSMSDRTKFYMASSIAPSTAKSYDNAFNHWIAYANSHGLPLMPVTPIDLGNCLSTIADSSGSISVITTVIAAVARKHWDSFLPSPTENYSFQRLLQGFKRILTKPPKQKEPLTTDILGSAIQMVRSSERLQEWRTVARMCLEFYGGCRWNDVSKLKISHCTFDFDGVSVFIPCSKTD